MTQRRLPTRGSDTMTPLDIHREAEIRAKELAETAVLIGGRPLPASDPEAVDLLRSTHDPSRDPQGIDERAVSVLASGGRLSRPSPTLEDAKRLYMQERVKGDINETAKAARLERVMDYLTAADVDKTRTLESLTREDARNVRDYLLRDLGVKTSTVRRYLNDVRAVISLGLREFDLREEQNPFNGLTVRAETVARDERKPIPAKLLSDIRARVASHASADLWRVWRLVEGTGCRLGEVTGLLVSDVRLDDEVPHIDLVPHPHRRLKNAGSARKVPLIGDALEAAREAVKAAGDGPSLFPAYGRVRGADAASAALMKHVRDVTDDPKIVVHSLRHTMEDRLSRAGVDEFDRNLVLGHTRGGMSERYGGPEARLEAAARALKAALAKPVRG